MPLGRMSWWRDIREPYLRNQSYGYGMDLVWTAPVGYQKSTGVVNKGECSSEGFPLAQSGFKLTSDYLRTTDGSIASGMRPCGQKHL